MQIQDPETDIIELVRGQFDYQRDSSYGSPSSNYFWFRKRRQVLTLISDWQKGIGQVGTFVDLGCADGTDLFLIRDIFERYGKRWLFRGFDISENSLQVGKLKQTYYGIDNVDFHLTNLAELLPIDDGSVDFLFCSEVLEHLVKPEILIGEIQRILKPNAFALITTPNEPNIFQRSYWNKSQLNELRAKALQNAEKFTLPDGRSIDVYGHISVKTCKQWDQIFSAAGFHLIDARRGAIVYGGGVFDTELLLGIKTLVEGMLDLLPVKLTRSFSDQMIALYRRH